MHALLRRRVPQIVGAYLATSWIFLEFTAWAVNQYALSPALSNFVVAALLLLVPAVALLAWRHGAPGQDEWTRTDAVIVGLTVLIAGGILTSVFRGQELGAATTVRVLEDADGNLVERTVPKEAFRRKVFIWPFDNPAGDPDLKGLQMGMWDGLITDLSQDLFVSTPTLFGTQDQGESLRETGYDLPFNIPLALKRDLTDARGAEGFLEVDLVALAGDTLSVSTRLFDTRTARQVATHAYRGADPFEIIDRMSVDVRRDLGIPEWQIESSLDLPTAQIITASREALSVYGQSWLAMYRSEWEAAESLAREAVVIDPGFALAHAQASYASIMLGNQSAARESMAESLTNAHRLPEPWRLSLQMYDRMFYRTDMDAAVRTGIYWTELYPNDVYAHSMLADAYMNMGAWDEEIGELRTILEVDPTNTDVLQRMAVAFRNVSEPDSALACYRRIAEIQPSDVRALLDIAETLWDDLLEFDEAALEFDRARVVAPREPEVSSQQARLEMRQGLFPEARTHLDEAAALARTAEERYAVASAEEVYFYLLGQYAGLRTAYARAIEAAGQHLVPVMAIQDVPTSELILNAAEWDGEQVDYALAQLDSMRASVEAPWNMLADIPATRIYLDVSDVASARTALESFRTINELFGDQSPWRRAETLFFEGRIAELEDGDCARSVHNYIQARDLYARSARTRWWLARCLTSLERWDEAGAEVDWLLERYPGHAKYHLLAARLHAARGATDESIAQLEVALDFWSEADEDYRPAAEARELLVDLRGRAESEPAGTDPPAAHRMPGARASRRAPDRSRRPLRTSASRRLP